MVTIVLKDGEAIFAEGNPDVYLADKDFERLPNDAELRQELSDFFGKSTCFGRLGTLQDNGMYKETQVDGEMLQLKGGILSYYEKVY